MSTGARKIRLALAVDECRDLCDGLVIEQIGHIDDVRIDIVDTHVNFRQRKRADANLEEIVVTVYFLFFQNFVTNILYLAFRSSKMIIHARMFPVIEFL